MLYNNSDLRSGASDGLFSIVVIIVPILKRFELTLQTGVSINYLANL